MKLITVQHTIIWTPRVEFKKYLGNLAEEIDTQCTMMGIATVLCN